MNRQSQNAPDLTIKSYEEAKENSAMLPSDSGLIRMTLTKGKGRQVIHKEPDQTIYVMFHSKGFKTINASLSSTDSTANIRFSQIFLPDGSMDGPFGRELIYNLPADGTYRISIHENMMAGDPWGGDFAVEIELNK